MKADTCHRTKMEIDANDIGTQSTRVFSSLRPHIYLIHAPH